MPGIIRLSPPPHHHVQHVAPLLSTQILLKWQGVAASPVEQQLSAFNAGPQRVRLPGDGQPQHLVDALLRGLSSNTKWLILSCLKLLVPLIGAACQNQGSSACSVTQPHLADAPQVCPKSCTKLPPKQERMSSLRKCMMSRWSCVCVEI